MYIWKLSDDSEIKINYEEIRLEFPPLKNIHMIKYAEGLFG